MPKVLLTPKFIKQDLTCPPTKHRIEYCDTYFPGLYIEVRSTCQQRGTYYLRYKDINNKTCHQKLGRSYELTLSEARQRAKTLKAEILLGADPRAKAKRQKEVMCFNEFATEHYLPYIKQRKRSYKNDESMLRLRLLPTFGDKPLNRITRQQIQSFHTALRDEDLSPAHCDHHLKLMRSMLNLAVQWQLLDKSPAEKIPLFREDNRLERYMSDEEQARLLAVLKTDSNQIVCCLVLFLLSTGARLNEALKATWDNIDTDKKVWRIPASDSKSKHVRSVPLNKKALEVLQQLNQHQYNPQRNLDDKPLQRHQGDKLLHLFINPRTGNRYVNINKSWNRIRTKAGLPKLRLHDLRHQYASNLVNGGRSLYEVQLILGHSDPSVTQRYAHLSTAALQDAAETASACLEGAPRQTAQR